MQTRLSSDDLNGMLEFPGGKIEGTETPKQAAIREVLEEVSVELKEDVLALNQIYNNHLENKVASLYIFTYCDDGIFPTEGWHNISDLEKFINKIPPANKQFIEKLIKSIG